MSVTRIRLRFRSLKTEIALGFTALLLLTALVAVIGWISLDRFARGVSQSESINLWVSSLLQLRRYEREYKLTRDSAQLQSLSSAIDRLQTQIKSTSGQFDEADEVVFLDDILAVTDLYRKSFETYVAQQTVMDAKLANSQTIMERLESITNGFAKNSGGQYHFKKQHLEELWSLFLRDMDEIELLRSFEETASLIERRLTLPSSALRGQQVSNAELSAHMAGITETLVDAANDASVGRVYQQFQSLTHELQRKLQVANQKPPKSSQGWVSHFSKLSGLLQQRKSKLERQSITHRLRYDVAQGQLSRAKIMTEAARQLQIWLGKLREQEKQFLLVASNVNAELVRNRVHQMELSAADIHSQLIEPVDRSALGEIANLLVNYRRFFEELIVILEKQRLSDRDMSDAISKLQSISSVASEKRIEELKVWQQKAIYQMVVGSLVAISTAVILALLIGRRLSLPITNITQAISKVAQGEHEVKTPGLDRLDEIGKMAAAVEVFKQTLVRAVRLQAQQAEENKGRRKAEAEVRELNIGLEKRVALRTQQLEKANLELEEALDTLTRAQEQLVESEKMASLAGLVAGVAHELNTPVGNCITANSLLADQLQELKRAYDSGVLSRNHIVDFLDSGGEVGGLIGDNLERAASLISTFKKLAMESSQDESCKYQLAEVFENSILSLNHSIESAGLTIEMHCDPDIILDGYPSDLFHIVSNLVSNSITHAYSARTESSKGILRLEAELIEPEVVIRYSDDGVGMSKDQKENIFEPFYTTCRGLGGTGLGMHLVYNLVSQRLKGQIRCYSELGKGTEFIIKVPVS